MEPAALPAPPPAAPKFPSGNMWWGMLYCTLYDFVEKDENYDEPEV